MGTITSPNKILLMLVSGSEVGRAIVKMFVPSGVKVGYCPHPVTVYTKGHIKGYI